MQTIRISVSQTPEAVAFRIDGGVMLAIIQREASNKFSIDMVFNSRTRKECSNLRYNRNSWLFAIDAVKESIRTDFADYGLNVEFFNLQAA